MLPHICSSCSGVLERVRAHARARKREPIPPALAVQTCVEQGIGWADAAERSGWKEVIVYVQSWALVLGLVRVHDLGRVSGFTFSCAFACAISVGEVATRWHVSESGTLSIQVGYEGQGLQPTFVGIHQDLTPGFDLNQLPVEHPNLLFHHKAQGDAPVQD